LQIAARTASLADSTIFMSNKLEVAIVELGWVVEILVDVRRCIGSGDEPGRTMERRG
jgi:hypothetical protein